MAVAEKDLDCLTRQSLRNSWQRIVVLPLEPSKDGPGPKGSGRYGAPIVEGTESVFNTYLTFCGPLKASGP